MIAIGGGRHTYLAAAAEAEPGAYINVWGRHVFSSEVHVCVIIDNNYHNKDKTITF